MRQRIALPPWQPDRSGTSGTFLAVADNVLPTADGYAPLPNFAPLAGGTLPGYPLGAASFLAADRLATTFAGTATDLFTYSIAGWSSVGSGYAASDENAWSFEQFGQRVIATNGADAPQFYALGMSTAFAPLPGNEGVAPPRFKLMAIVNNFLFVGQVNGEASTVGWSGINNSSEWRVGVGQSDISPLPDGGDVTALAGGEYGLIFQAESIRRATYVGGNVIFQIDVISPNVGCLHPRAFAQVGRQCFFLSSRGFMVCDGASVSPIGSDIIDRTFLAAMDRSYMGRMSCVADPVRKVVYWTLPAAEPGIAFAYSWALQRWSRVVMPLRLMAAGRSRYISLDEELPPNDALFDEGLSFDDPAYGGGAAIFYAFNAANVVGTLTGTPAAATLGLGPVSLAGESRKMAAQRWRMESDCTAGVTLTLDGRQREGDAPTVTVHSGPSASGDIVGRRRARTLRASVSIAAGQPWTYFNALSCEFERAGAR